MALLAKYYLSYNSPMGMGAGGEGFDCVKRRTAHLDSGWRPPPLLGPNATANGGTTSAPNSPRLSRKGTFYRGHRSSCDYGEGHKSKLLDGAKQSSLVRRFSARNRSRNAAAASAPTSPRQKALFGDFRCSSEPIDTKLSTVNSVDEAASRPMSPLCQNGVDRDSKFSPPASRRRSRYATAKQPQTYGGVPSVFSFSSSASSANSPPSSAGSSAADKRNRTTTAEQQQQQQHAAAGATGCGSEMRRRCSSGPLDESAKQGKGGHMPPKKPELQVTVSYSKNTSFITATITRARYLPQNSRSFVRVHLYDGFKPISLKQTTVAEGGPNVEFKQAFMFSLGKDTVWTAHILVELYEYDIIGNESKFGDVVIGPKANGSGFSQWRQMCTHPNTPCSVWHSII